MHLLPGSLRLWLSYSKLLVFFVQLSSLSFLLLFIFNPFYPRFFLFLFSPNMKELIGLYYRNKDSTAFLNFAILYLQALPFTCPKYTPLSITERSRFDSLLSNYEYRYVI